MGLHLPQNRRPTLLVVLVDRGVRQPLRGGRYGAVSVRGVGMEV